MLLVPHVHKQCCGKSNLASKEVKAWNILLSHFKDSKVLSTPINVFKGSVGTWHSVHGTV